MDGNDKKHVNYFPTEWYAANTVVEDKNHTTKWNLNYTIKILQLPLYLLSSHCVTVFSNRQNRKRKKGKIKSVPKHAECLIKCINSIPSCFALPVHNSLEQRRSEMNWIQCQRQTAAFNISYSLSLHLGYSFEFPLEFPFAFFFPKQNRHRSNINLIATERCWIIPSHSVQLITAEEANTTEPQSPKTQSKTRKYHFCAAAQLNKWRPKTDTRNDTLCAGGKWMKVVWTLLGSRVFCSCAFAWHRVHRTWVSVGLVGSCRITATDNNGSSRLLHPFWNGLFFIYSIFFLFNNSSGQHGQNILIY